MSRTSVLKSITWIWNQLLRWRWGVVAVTIPAVLLVLILQERPAHLSDLDTNFLSLVFIFGLVMPILGALLLGLIQTKSKTPGLGYLQGLYQALGQDIALARDWDHVSMTLYRLILPMVPIRGLSLSLYDPSSNKYKRVGEYGDSQLGLQNDSSPLESRRPLTSQRDVLSNVMICSCWEETAQKQINQICLFLSPENKPTAVIHLRLPHGYSLQSVQEDFLNEIAPELAYFIDYLQLKHSAHEQANNHKSEKHRIAQHIHDTLGDNLAYLHLKLDQLSEKTTSKETTQTRQEIEHLRDIANISYEQVRNSLIELREENSTDLTSALNECAQNISERASFTLHISSHGEPQDLPPHIQRKILYVFREALRNVERHARASHVFLKLVWNQKWLTITSSDDGKGFDLKTAIKMRGHYGLNMIEEMAEEIKGDLSIESTIGKGTKVVLRLPL